MNLIYDYTIAPNDKYILYNINLAANRLYSKLSKFNVLEVDSISDYNKQYFGTRLKNLIYSLQFSSYILSWSLAYHGDIEKNEFTFLEYGAGSGMTSLLAKEIGLRVVYNDLYDVSCQDARTIAKMIGNEADYYIQGQIDDVINFFKTTNLKCNSVASSDVIEHIYEIESFFRKLALLPGRPLSVVMASGANTFHPYIRKKLMTKQKKLEYMNREKEWGHKERDTLRAYRDIREESVRLCFSRNKREPTEQEIQTLVANTRGMIEKDIQTCVEKYIQKGIYPPLPSHPTNTCDPYTGNLAEHLMNPYDLASIMSREGFNTRVLSGYYGNMDSTLRRLVGKFLDRIIRSAILGKKTLMLAPFYTIYGKRN